MPCPCALMYFFPKRLSVESSITHGALLFLPVKPVDNEKDVAVEAESLELEVEEDNDDESVELEEGDDEDDMSTRESHSILIGGTSVLKSSIAKKGRGENSVFVHFCDDLLVQVQQPGTVPCCFAWKSMHQKDVYAKICMQAEYKRTPLICLQYAYKSFHIHKVQKKYHRNRCTWTHRKGPKMMQVHKSAYVE